MNIEIKDCRDKDLEFFGFVTATDKEKDLYLHCQIFIFSDNAFHLNKFIHGSVGKYKFQCYDWERETLGFRGVGRGRKPDSAVDAMREFLYEVSNEIFGKKITDYPQDKT